MGEPKISQKFRSIFAGYERSFVKHVPPFETEDSTGKVKAKFVGLAQYKSNSSFHPAPPEGYNDGDYVPLTLEQYEEHLNGGNGLAVSPLMDVVTKEGSRDVVKKDVCFWGLIDIDVYGVDFMTILARLRQSGYSFCPFVSKSHGLHIYFFFAKAEPAQKVVDALSKVVEVFGLGKLYNDGKGKSRVEIFPQHAMRKQGLHDKCVFLPFYNGEKSYQKLITPEGKLRGLEKAVDYIPSTFTSVDAIEKATAALPLHDAPYCIQMLALSGSLGASSGRNDYLFSSAIYLKMKHGDAFAKKELEDINGMMAEPLDDGEVNMVYESAKVSNAQLFGRCNKSPCADICDKQLCKLRKYGVGREKGNTVSNIEFGKIVRVRAEIPYYLWEARLSGSQEYKTLRIDGAENLLNQRTIQKATIDVLGQIALTVTQPLWEKTVNQHLAELEEIDAPASTDTTELRELKDNLMRFLTHRKNKKNAPYTVNVKQVFYMDGYYYFKTDGFVEYLRSRGFNKLGRINLREELIKYGCEEGSLLWNNTKGEPRLIQCWKKAEDEELLSLDTFYDDIQEADELILAGSLLNKEGEGNTSEDMRF